MKTRSKIMIIVSLIFVSWLGLTGPGTCIFVDGPTPDWLGSDNGCGPLITYEIQKSLGVLWYDEPSAYHLTKILDYCKDKGTGVPMHQSGMRYSNDTHYIDNDTCEWEIIEKGYFGNSLFEKNRNELSQVLDWCNDVSSVKYGFYNYSNDTYSINTRTCEWKEHETYPTGDSLCVPYVEKKITGQDWSNKTHYFDTTSCTWKNDPNYDALNSKGCPQFCPKEKLEVNGGFDTSKITSMEPNSVEFFYYPSSPKDEDTYRLFMLIRLPEWMGGASDDVSAFRAYSARALDDTCIVKYWPDPGRERIENPCQGGMYRVIDGALTYGATHLSNAMHALPYLDLYIDEFGTIHVEPPTWNVSTNGVIGHGRIISSSEIRENSEFLVDSFANFYPKYPPIPVEFAGYVLSEINPESHSVTVRYLDFPHKSGHITMTVGLQTIRSIDPYLTTPVVEYWKIGDTEIRISGSAMDKDSTTHESFRTYEIKFKDGYHYTIEGKNLEFLKKSIVANFFPDFGYGDLVLVSSTGG